MSVGKYDDPRFFADAEVLAKKAYGIFRSMKNPMTEPHWDDLTRDQKGLLEWTVRFTLLQEIR